MDMKPEPGDADYVKIMTLKKEVLSSVLSAGVRLNDATLHKRDEDKVGELLKRVKERDAISLEDLFSEDPVQTA